MEIISPWREKSRDKLWIISLYQIKIITLRDIIWVKKNSLFLFTQCSLSYRVFSLTLSIFLFPFACSHSRSSSRLHQSSVSLAGASLFSGASHLHPSSKWPNASPFISSSFPSFLPFTLFISSHNKCKPTYLDFASTNFFSSALP